MLSTGVDIDVNHSTGQKKSLFDVSKGVFMILFRQLIYVQQSSNALPRDQGLMKKRACTGSRW